jgi:hypothetical protein
MANHLADNAAPSLGRACSASCTKAGIAALLLSVVALSLLPALGQLKGLRALSTHVLGRLMLKSAVADLDADPCWQVVRSEPDAERGTLVLLKKRVCDDDGKSLRVVVIPSPTASPPAQPSPRTMPLGLSKSDRIRSGSRRPPPPRDLLILISIEPLADIEKALVALGEVDTLSRARSVFQYRFGWSIYRWEKRAIQLSNRSVKENKLPTSPNTKNHDLHKYLTLADIRFLADFEFPDASAVEQVFTEHTRLTLPSALIPIGLSTATTLLEFSLLLCVIYFWLFQREARLSPNYPEWGTLLAVFDRTTASRVLFLLFASVPAWCSALVAARSTELAGAWNIILAVLVVIVTALIARQARHRAAPARQVDQRIE